MSLPRLAFLLSSVLLLAAPAWARDKENPNRFVDVSRQEQFADQAAAIRRK